MLKMKIIKYATILLTVSVLFSCGSSQEKKPVSVLYDQIVKSEKGIIRGVNLNDKIENIKKQEDEKFIVAETESVIEYEYSLENGGSYVVAYHFDSEGCYEINVDTYFETAEPAKEVLEMLKVYFDDKFGEPENTDDLYIWNDKNKITTVELDYFNQVEGEILLTIFANE
jgi:hypothetical protein